ncbi:RHS repeat domain-containing protein [Poseidonocella sp. HB161398]|uniref:RHS repeat domain-containing protein n=1 Tax=Poseidonocella sp. HB161398 TaxID=2320855 RepID=UPI00110910B6|nr:RHS repeat-associated core domain-containing protein [Poseidonocella sp. HB161398]
MAPSTAFSGANIFNSQSAPSRRSGQSDGVQKGALAASVNLFKGDVDLTHPLVSLKGRAQDGSDTLKISLQYGSNVRHGALTWNAEAPTGTLGLGWDLPLSAITLQGDGGPAPSGASYTMSDNGISGTLVRQDIVPVLLTAAASLLDAAQSGGAVPPGLRAVFTGNGLPLSPEAVLEGGPADWSLRDAALEQDFALCVRDGAIEIRYGGEFYQLQNYSFCHIVFYPAYDRWLVIDESGARRSFGGGVGRTEGGIATSRGNSVSWSVWWTGGGDRPAWSGAGTSASGQVAVANAWYLESVTDRFGNAQSFGYNDFPRDPATGLLQYAEQSVTEGGPAFTKAVYLTSATDVFGRQVALSYAPKLWSSAGAQEYSDPHAATPPLGADGYFAPTGYQDAYEVLCLAGLTVTGATGRQMMRYAFDYAPVADSPVAYIGGSSGQFAKRLLTGISKFDSDGAPVPGLKMTYCLEADPADGQPGALVSLTGASGGTVSYSYTRQSLAQADRTVDIAADGADQTNLFYGPDYTVLAFYSSATASLALKLASWNGTWQIWQPGEDGIVATGNIDLTTLECQAAQDFAVLSYMDFAGSRYVHVWNKLAARPGQWQGAGALGLDMPIVLENAGSRKLDILTGAAHFLIADQSQNDPYQSGNAIARYSWRWDLGQWIVDSVPLDHGGAWIAAGDSSFATYSNGDQTLRLYWRNADLSWCETPSAIAMPGAAAVNSWDDIALAAGTASAAFTMVVSQGGNLQAVQLSSVSWDSSYALEAADHGVISDYFDAGIGTPLTTVPSVVSDSFITLNSNAFRRTGTGWDSVSLITSANYQNVSQAFVSGQDVIGVMTVNQSGRASVTMRSWVPGQGWGAATAPVEVSTLVPNDISPADTRNNFSLGGDWLDIGSLLYYRGSACDWNAVLEAGPSIFMIDAIEAAETDFAWLDSTSLLDSAPSFVALDTVTTAGSGAVTCLVFRNGAGTPLVTELAGRSLFDGGDQGQSAATQPVFATVAQTSGPPASIRLHRYQGYSVDGPVTHCTVCAAALDDAMGDISHVAYACIPDSAICTSTGDDVSFHQTFTYPGTADPQTAPLGSVETLYLNTAAGVDRDNYFDLLEGQQLAQITRDASGQIVASSTTKWEVVATVGADPVTGGLVPLRGGWARAAEQTETTDCVTRTTVMSYETAELPASLTGSPLSTLSARVNAAGEREVFCRSQTPALLAFPALWAQHAVEDAAQAAGYCMPVKDGAPDREAATLVKAQASLWSLAASALGADVMTPVRSASYDLVGGTDPDFPFAAPDSAAGLGWLLARRYTGFTPWAQPCEEVDALGVPSAILHGADGMGVVAHARDTTSAGLAATFFQSWEQLDRLETDGSYDPDCCHTGTQALRLGGGQSVRMALTPGRAQRYVASLRYRSASGQATLAFGTAQLELGATGGDWCYRTLPLEAGTGTLGLSVTAAGGDVWVDSLAAVPLASQATFQLQDPDSLAETTGMDGGGRCRRMLLSPAGDTIGCQSSDGELHDLRIKGYGRAMSASDSLDPACPNSTIALQCAAGGSVDGFRDGGAWTGRWTPSGSCTASDGLLVLAAGSGLDLADPRFTDPADPAQATAASIEIRYGEGLDFSVAFGGMTVSWTADGLSCDAAPLLADPPACPGNWVFVRSEGATLFYGDGQLLVSLPGSGPRALSIRAAAPLGLRRLCLGYDIRLGTIHADGAGRTRQAQQLWGLDSIVVDSLRDTANRQIATTKPCPGSFGSGAALPPMAYRPGTVDRADFAANWERSAQMSGDVSDYYSGRPWQGLAPSDDGGYPYYGIRYEASPRAQQTEIGRPGARHALDPAVPAADRQTLRLSSGATWQSPPPAPGEGPPYHIDEALTAGGVSYRQATGKLGQVMSLAVGSAAGGTLMQSTAARSYANLSAPQASTTVTLPRGNGNAATPAEAGFDRVRLQDGKARAISFCEPNSGETQVVLDSAGAIRFLLPRMGAEEAFCLYRKYDRCGRQVEEGLLEGDWDTASLAPHADDPDWPDAATDGAATRAAWTSFDGDGSEPLLIGQKTEMTRITPCAAGSVTVTDSYSYDLQARISSVSRRIDAQAGAEAALHYAYNTLGQVTSIQLPQEAPVSELAYAYNDQGQTETIRCGASGDLLASYVYGPDRKMVSQQLHGDRTWTRSLSYTSDERPLSLQAAMDGNGPVLRLDYTYTDDGLVLDRSIDLNGTPVADTFGYDGSRALSSVAGANEAAYGPPDLNGNLAQLTEGGATTVFSPSAATDQIAAIATDGGAAVPCAWNARGNMTSGNGRSYAYDPASSRTIRVARDETVLELAYGGMADRAMKAGADGATFYFPGAGSTPLLRKTPEGWDLLVSGPGAMAAFLAPGRRLALLTDVQNSLLLATDESGAVAQTLLYRAFGSANPGLSSGSGPVPYRFQGQEWDGEVALYNFNARLYDPALARFHAMDLALQYSSPYLFEANSPPNQTDPSGQMSQAAQTGLGVASVGLALGGIALTIATAGVGSAVAAGMEAAAATADSVTFAAAGSVDVIADTAVGVGDTLEASGTVTVAAAAESSDAGIAQASAASLRRSAKNVSRITAGTKIMTRIPIGIGAQDARTAFSTDNKDFSMKDFAVAAATGGTAWLISGVVFAGESAALDGLFRQWKVRKSAEIGTRILASTLTTTALSDVSQVVTNCWQDQDWSTGLVRATLTSGFSGLVAASGGAATCALADSFGRKKADWIYQRARRSVIDRQRAAQASPDSHPANQPPTERTALRPSQQSSSVPAGSGDEDG